MSEIEPLNANALALLRAQTPVKRCRCTLAACCGWTAVADHDCPAADMQRRGTLRNVHAAEPSFEEHHPQGTRLDLPDAPISPMHDPCNRAEVWQCERCWQLVLRYEEVGGYYRESRARRVVPSLIVVAR